MEDSASDMAEVLGIAPGSPVKDRQRFDLLRSWHEGQEVASDVERDEEEPPK